MLQFDAGVCCHVFRQEIAVVLHHASTWSAIAGVSVVVIRLGECHNGPTQQLASDLAVDLDVNGSERSELTHLYSYLARTLGRQYAVALEDDRVHVEYFARG
jgi:hypothetical protein